MNYAPIIILSLMLCNYTYGDAISSPLEKIKGEEFIYYNVSMINTYIHLQLISVSGDCDLYVSNIVDYPTYHDYSFCSATCGVDSIIIPKRIKGQIHIGIYAHPAYDISECYLNVCFIQNIEKRDEYTDELTEISSLTETVIEEQCKRTESSSKNRSILTLIFQQLSSLQTDSILLEILFSLADSLF